MSASPDPGSMGAKARVGDALRRAALVIEQSPWELGPSQRVGVDFAPNANETEVQIHGCHPATLASLRVSYGGRAKVKRDLDDPHLGIRWVEFQHAGLTVVFYRR